MTEPETLPMPEAVPELQLGKVGPVLVFLHANGYPPESYSPLLETFAGDYHVRAMFLRPLWRTSKATSIHSWHELADDFLTWLHEQRPDPVVVVGHSMGAIVALRAALQEPSRFSALVLLDPVLVTARGILTWRLMRHLGVGHRLHSVIRRAKKRRAVFRDSEEAFAGYRRHPVFRRLGDHELRQAVRGMLERKDGRLALRYPPEWEARHVFHGHMERRRPVEGAPNARGSHPHRARFRVRTRSQKRRVQPCEPPTTSSSSRRSSAPPI